LSQLFGFNFEQAAVNADSQFSETDIRNYIKYDNGGIYDNLVNLAGNGGVYHSSLPAVDLYSSVTDATLNSAFTLTMPASYNTFDAANQAETQYFKNNIALTAAGSATFTIPKLADTYGDFKVVAYTYSGKGFSSAEYDFTVRPSFTVEFDLPARMAVGDIVNVTATVYNGEGHAMVITPSLTTNPNFTADFVYSNWVENPNTNVFAASDASTYTLAATDLEKVVSF
jgi:hypothetical protein